MHIAHNTLYCAYMYQSSLIKKLALFGASLSKPHIDHDNGPRMRNNGIYLCLYHLPRICCTLVHEICVHPEMLCVFQYIDMLTCVIYNCRLNSKNELVCCQDY